MADVEIGARVKVDTGDSAKKITDVKDSIKGANKELSTVGGSKDFAALKDKVTQAIPALDGVTSAGSSFNSILNLIRANPIIFALTALVAIVVGIYKAFASTYEGGQKVEQIFAAIKAATQVLLDRLVQLAGAAVKLFKGDFKGAMEDAKASVTGLGDEIVKVAGKTMDLTRQLQEIKKQERESNIDEAAREKRLALLREQLNDDNVSLKEKKRIALELKKDVDENYADDLRRDREKARIKIELLKQEKDGERKNADEIAQIQIDLYKAETANALEGVRVNKQIRAIENQEKQVESTAAKAAEAKRKENKAAADAAEKAAKENLKAFNERLNKLQNDNELLDIKDANQRKLKELAQALAAERKVISDDYTLRKITLQQKSQLLSAATKNNELQVAEVRATIAKETLAAEEAANAKRTADGLAHAQTFTAGLKALSDANIAQSKAEAEAKIQHQVTVANTLTSLSALVGEQTVIGKGLAAAAAVINTYQGATKALAQGGIFGYIGAAGIIASGLASVKKIMQTKIPGASGDSSASISSSATAAPVAPKLAASNTTTLDANSVQAIGNATNKAYVVERDMTNNQERVRALNRAARIG